MLKSTSPKGALTSSAKKMPTPAHKLSRRSKSLKPTSPLSSKTKRATVSNTSRITSAFNQGSLCSAPHNHHLRSFSTSPSASTVSPAVQEEQRDGESYSRIVSGPRLLVPEVNILERVISHAQNPNKSFFRLIAQPSKGNAQNSPNAHNKVYTYTHLLYHALETAPKIKKVLDTLGNPLDSIDLTKNPESVKNMGHRVCILAPSFEYSSYTLATWISGAVAVPLHIEHPAIEMVHYLDESGAKVLIHHPKFKAQAEEVLQLFRNQSPGKNCSLVELDEFEGYYTQVPTPALDSTSTAQPDTLSSQNSTSAAETPTDTKIAPQSPSSHATQSTPSSSTFGAFAAEGAPIDDFTKIYQSGKNDITVKKALFASIPQLIKKNRQENGVFESGSDGEGGERGEDNSSEITIRLPSPQDPALFIFTSGTTGKAKAVVLSHRNVLTNIRGMIQEWGWSSSDHILDLLPKHHIHGVVNVLYTSMWVGSRLTSLGSKFNAKAIWQHFASTSTKLPPAASSKRTSSINGISLNTTREDHIMVTKKDFQKLAQRPHFSSDVTLECGRSSRTIPALRHSPNNYDIANSLKQMEDEWGSESEALSNTSTNVSLELPAPGPEAYSLFMAVPTIYHKLVESYHADFPTSKSLASHAQLTQKQLSLACSQFRLMVSGSMALPRTTLEKWKKLSGHVLLERYGMSEIGMALTNKYVERRHPGAVGWPFPGVSIRVQIKHTDDYTGKAADEVQKPAQDQDQDEDEDASVEGASNAADVVGELLIQGDNVFEYYFNRPEKTAESFIEISPSIHTPSSTPSNFAFGTAFKPPSKGQNTDMYPKWAEKFQDMSATPKMINNWFLTGDIALIDKNNCVSLLGRSSVDILKVSGYKISALEVERVLLDHPGIHTLAVIGIPDEATGQSIAAIVVPNQTWIQQKQIAAKATGAQNIHNVTLDVQDIVDFAKDKIPKYKLPRQVVITDRIPTNAMGKINKKHLLQWFLDQPAAKQ